MLALALLDSFGKLHLKYWMGHFTLPSIKPGSASVSTARTRLSVLYQSFPLLIKLGVSEQTKMLHGI